MTPERIPDTVGSPTIPFYRAPPPDPAVYPQLEHQWRLGTYTKGDNVAQLAQELEDYLNVEHVILTSSGTVAIAVGLLAAIKGGWIKPSPRVLVSAYTWDSVPYAISMGGGTPIYGDIDQHRWHLDTHIHGLNYDAVCLTDTFGARLKLPATTPHFIDAAHSMGLPKVGGRGIYEAFSLAATKVVTGGEGGVIATTDSQFALTAMQIARFVGRLPEASAILALGSLQSIDYSLKWRKSIADAYHRFLGEHVVYQDTGDGTNNYVFPVRLNETQLGRLRRRRDFAIRQYYNPPLDGCAKNALKVANSVVCLPQVSAEVCWHVANVILGKEVCV